MSDSIFLFDELESLETLEHILEEVDDDLHIVEAFSINSNPVSLERRLELYGDTPSQQTLYRAFVWFVKEVGDNAVWCDGAYSNNDAERIISKIYQGAVEKSKQIN